MTATTGWPGRGSRRRGPGDAARATIRDGSAAGTHSGTVGGSRDENIVRGRSAAFLRERPSLLAAAATAAASARRRFVAAVT